MAVQGMENGLHAIVFASILLFGASYLRRPGRPLKKGTGSDLKGDKTATNNGREVPVLLFHQAASAAASRFDQRVFYLKLGFLLALFALIRVDSALLALIMGGLVLFGFVRPNGAAHARPNLVGALWLTLPGLVLFGGALVFSQWYFGAALPISGRVKLYFESVSGPLHGGIWRELAWHLRYLFDLSVWPLANNLESTLWWRWSVVWPMQRTRVILLVVLILGATHGLQRLWFRRHVLSWQPTAYRWFTLGWILFVVAHFCSYACVLPHFTQYGTWYFAPELMSLWLLYGWAFVSTGQLLSGLAQFIAPALRRTSWIHSHALLPVGAALLLTTAGIAPVLTLPELEQRHNPFLTAAHWLTSRLPVGQAIGTCSSGIVGYFSPSHQVVNLDGLMNDKRYLEQYLSTLRIPEYMRLRNIGYFADYSTTAGWRSRGFGGIDFSHMQLVRWWPMDADTSYGIWKVLPPGPRRDVLDPFDGYGDRVSQIQFAAYVLGRFDMVDENQGTASSLGSGASAKRIFTSIIDPASMRLKHVLIPGDKIASLGVTRRNIDVPVPKPTVFAGAVELIGTDTLPRSVRRGERFFMTRYWTLRDGPRLSQDASIELWGQSARSTRGQTPDAGKGLWHATQPCHGTHPFHRWQPGEIVVETYGITVAPDLEPGPYTVVLRVKDAEKGYLPPDVSNQCGDLRGTFLATIEVQ
jgi:hypothetical protein